MANELVEFAKTIKVEWNYNDAGLFWQTWRWKLDSFKIKQKEESCDLMISMILSGEQWTPDKLLNSKKAGFFCHNVYSTLYGNYIWQYERIKNGEIILKYLVSAAGDRISLLEDHSHSDSLAFEYLGIIMPYVMLNYDLLTFHGVLMEHQGQGIIISADSGTGKTTHARLWRDNKNALIINGDRATCCKQNDMWMGYGLPWSGSSGEQINRSVPLKAFVVLERGTENKAYKLSMQEKLSYILPHVFYASWDGNMVEKMLELLDDFLINVPVIRLCCRPDEESVEVLNKVLEEI